MMPRKYLICIKDKINTIENAWKSKIDLKTENQLLKIDLN